MRKPEKYVCNGCGEDVEKDENECSFCRNKYCQECILQHEMNCDKDNRKEER